MQISKHLYVTLYVFIDHDIEMNLSNGSRTVPSPNLCSENLSKYCNTSSCIFFFCLQLADESLLSQPPSDQGATYMSSSCSSATQYFNLDDSAASELLSIHQTGLMFMSHDQLQAIADALHPSQPIQV